MSVTNIVTSELLQRQHFKHYAHAAHMSEFSGQNLIGTSCPTPKLQLRRWLVYIYECFQQPLWTPMTIEYAGDCSHARRPCFAAVIQVSFRKNICQERSGERNRPFVPIHLKTTSPKTESSTRMGASERHMSCPDMS